MVTVRHHSDRETEDAMNIAGESQEGGIERLFAIVQNEKSRSLVTHCCLTNKETKKTFKMDYFQLLYTTTAVC